MSIPRWILDKRHTICANCEATNGCSDKFTILDRRPKCHLGKLNSEDDEIAERAWPSGATRISGCCDSALNYGE